MGSIMSRLSRSQSGGGAASVARRLLITALAAPAISATPLLAQQGAGWHELTAGSQLEDYLRVLQIAGRAPVYPMSVRGLSPNELDRLVDFDGAHPWQVRLAQRQRDGLAIRRPELRMIANSGGPRGGNDGALWSGRGLTAAAQAGFVHRRGAVTVILNPIAFWAQNASFPLADNGRSDRQRFGHSRYFDLIDLPQRFGDSPYFRIDPGQSAVRVDLRGVAMGLSTENEIWGPAADLPLILGTNAPGIPRFFLGTASPRDIWVGHIHGRVFLGSMAQSAFSAMPADSGRRMGSGVVVTFSPRGLPGVEIGGSRFIHRLWPRGGPTLRDLTIPFGTLVKGVSLDSVAPDNDLGSVFFRVAARGAELYGEFATDDLSFAAPAGIVARELITEPDHISAYMVGFRRVWAGEPAEVTSLRIEVMNSRITHLRRIRYQADMYIHLPLLQGHTHRGQLLAAPVGVGGEGIVVTADRYHRAGRWGLSASRMGSLTSAEDAPDLPRDVVYSLAAGGSLWRGPWEVGIELRGDIPVDGNARPGAGGSQLTLSVRRGIRVLPLR
jgi:hypothetical protein